MQGIRLNPFSSDMDERDQGARVIKEQCDVRLPEDDVVNLLDENVDDLG